MSYQKIFIDLASTLNMSVTMFSLKLHQISKVHICSSNGHPLLKEKKIIACDKKLFDYRNLEKFSLFVATIKNKFDLKP